MTEEEITLAIMEWLSHHGWNIISFDFPQSGAGKAIHPNNLGKSNKNKGSIIPDIIAIKKGKVVFFENKDRFLLSDFEKVHHLRQTTDYSNAINNLLKGYAYSTIYYGVGLPDFTTTRANVQENIEKIDFAIFVSSTNQISEQIKADFTFG